MHLHISKWGSFTYTANLPLQKKIYKLAVIVKVYLFPKFSVFNINTVKFLPFPEVVALIK